MLSIMINTCSAIVCANMSRCTRKLIVMMILINLGLNSGDSSQNETESSIPPIAGDIIWSWQLGSKMDDQVTDVKLDKHGDVFLAGYTLGQFLNSYRPELDPSWVFGVDIRENAWVAKLSGSDGAYLWGWQKGTADPMDTAYATALEVDPKTADVFVVGGTNGYLFKPNAEKGSLTFGTRDAWAARLDGQTGSIKWGWQQGSALDEEVLSVALDPTSGDLILTGYTHGDFFHPNSGPQAGDPDSDRLADPFVCRLDAESGTVLWGWQIKDDNVLQENFHTYAMATDFDNKGHIYVTGYTGGNIFGPNYSGFDDAWVVKVLAQNGGLIWGTQWGHQEGYDFTTSLTINADQDVIVTGSTMIVNTENSNTSTKSWVTKLSGSDGTVLWEWEHEDDIQHETLWEYTADASSTGLKNTIWAAGNSEYTYSMNSNGSSSQLADEEYGTGWLWLVSLLSLDGSLLWKWKGGTSTSHDEVVGLSHSGKKIGSNDSEFDTIIIAGNTMGDFFKLNAGGSDCWCLKVLVPFYEEKEESEFSYKYYFYKLKLDPFAMGWPLNFFVLLGIIISFVIFSNIYESILDDFHASERKRLKPTRSFRLFMKAFQKKQQRVVLDESPDTVLLFGRSMKKAKKAQSSPALRRKGFDQRHKSDTELNPMPHPFRNRNISNNSDDFQHPHKQRRSFSGSPYAQSGSQRKSTPISVLFKTNSWRSNSRSDSMISSQKKPSNSLANLGNFFNGGQASNEDNEETGKQQGGVFSQLSASFHGRRHHSDRAVGER